MSYVWFWTFWHWSREGFRDGALLRGPLHGVGGHWDEWFRHEASAADRRAVADAGRTAATQRAFVGWLARRWAREAMPDGEPAQARFVLAQLAQVPPFDGWGALARYRAGYGVAGVAAVVLAEGSAGEAADVRGVEVVLLPRAVAAAPAVVAEGFEADPVELHAARRAAMAALGGRALGRLLARWVVGGRRPYPRWLRAALVAGWAVTAAILVLLVLGPDPGDALAAVCTALVALWAVLVCVAFGVAVHTGVGAWRTGRRWRARLAVGEVRLRMRDGLVLKGGSAGLAFALTMLLAAARGRPRAAGGSWLWRAFTDVLRTERGVWAATGVVGADGRVEEVVLAPKLRASLLHDRVRHLLVPRQRGATPRGVAALGATLADVRRGGATVALPPETRAAPPLGAAAPPRLGFAASPPRLDVRRCRHVADAVAAIVGLRSTAQGLMNVGALVVSGVMLAALPDLRRVVTPPAAPPLVVAPASPSPYYLWVNLDTRDPGAFSVELESDYWANRRAPVVDRGEPGVPPRAELRLLRAVKPGSRDVESGTVWVERRRRLFSREFLSGERVGRYTVAYVARAGRR